MYGHLDNWIDQEIPSAFKHKDSAERVTTGIWIWSQPIIKTNKNGQEVAIFLMDTQGWHDDISDASDRSLVFGLSSLISSVLIVNFKNIIGQDDLSYLQAFSTNAQWEASLGKMNVSRS